MPATTLVSVATLRAHLDDPAWAIVDCRFMLADPPAGEAAYAAAHIPGAVYAHLDRDLCGPIVPGQTGRHPLPAVDALAATVGRWGIADGVQVVCYDAAGGAMAAARGWWLLQWLGHPAAAVLDGGWPAWLAAGGPTASGVEQRPPRAFVARPQAAWVAEAADVAAAAADPGARVLDVRAGPRYRGEVEPIDPVAGHIPGAVCAPYEANVDATGHLLPPEALRALYAPLLGEVPPGQTIAYCGSGVTAAHTVLALAAAGLPGARLYPGSWSEWILDPARPIATGAEP